ncbi:MAG: toll/interleukin-1 receptor domain-containing protein [Pseudomonadota bacterium]|nr:toll/interleukin-1 receptor domain-containing protein [Pseudomonadota bacterium]
MRQAFLSYSRADAPFAEELYRRLIRDGVDCFYDQESIAWGTNWVRALERGLDECDSIVLVLTGDFVRSKWTELERTSLLAEEPAAVKRKMRPLLRASCEVPRFLKPIQSIDVTTDEKFEEAYPRICRELGGVLRSDERPAARATLPPVVQLPRRARMPYRSLGRAFAGRVGDLWRLHDLLVQSSTAVVAGIGVVAGTGGLGKTQLATEYVHRFAGYYPGGVFWTDADQGLPVIIGQITDAAGAEIDGALSVERQREQLWHSLGQTPSLVLVVLDNFPEVDALEPWLPVGANIRTIVTTRRRGLSGHPNVSLELLSALEGVALLNGGERQFGADAARLVETLGGLPLALELARNFLNLRPTLTVDALLEEMARLGEIATLKIFEDQYADELPTGHEKAVSATFQLSWDLVSSEAQWILMLMAVWAPAPVPRRLLRRALGDESDSRLTDPLDASVAELARLSLIELDEDFDPQTHRLVGAFVALKVPAGDELRQTYVDAVRAETSRVDDDGDTQSYADLETVLPHAEWLTKAPLIRKEDASAIADSVCSQHRKRGRYRLAEGFARKALALAQAAFEPGHPSIATSQSNLATVLKDLGELEEARDLLRQALAADERSFEPGHPSIATRQSNLALVLKDLGELEEARELLRTSHASFQRTFGQDHPNTKTVRANLAAVDAEIARQG